MQQKAQWYGDREEATRSEDQSVDARGAEL